MFLFLVIIPFVLINWWLLQGVGNGGEVVTTCKNVMQNWKLFNFVLVDGPWIWPYGHKCSSDGSLSCLHIPGLNKDTFIL
jgi:hypothetical protein